MKDMLIMPLLPPLGRHQRQQTPGWASYAGTKRKAHVAEIDDDFDPGCGPAPSKQFAGDNHFYFNPCETKVPPDDVNILDVDEEMELASFETAGSLNALATPSDSSKAPDKLGKEFQDAQLPPNSLISSRGLDGVSLVLSSEVQETLSQLRNEDMILPKLVADKVKHAHSMALVVWKPPTPIGPLSDDQLQKKVTTPTSGLKMSSFSRKAVDPPKMSVPTPSVNELETVGIVARGDEEDEDVMDTS